MIDFINITTVFNIFLNIQINTTRLNNFYPKLYKPLKIIYFILYLYVLLNRVFNRKLISNLVSSCSFRNLSFYYYTQQIERNFSCPIVPLFVHNIARVFSWGVRGGGGGMGVIPFTTNNMLHVFILPLKPRI